MHSPVSLFPFRPEVIKESAKIVHVDTDVRKGGLAAEMADINDDVRRNEREVVERISGLQPVERAGLETDNNLSLFVTQEIEHRLRRSLEARGTEPRIDNIRPQQRKVRLADVRDESVPRFGIVRHDKAFRWVRNASYPNR